MQSRNSQQEVTTYQVSLFDGYYGFDYLNPNHRILESKYSLCGGGGSFTYETPEGTQGEVCDICEGVGVVPKDYEPKPPQQLKDPF